MLTEIPVASATAASVVFALLPQRPQPRADRSQHAAEVIVHVLDLPYGKETCQSAIGQGRVMA